MRTSQKYPPSTCNTQVSKISVERLLKTKLSLFQVLGVETGMRRVKGSSKASKRDPVSGREPEVSSPVIHVR